MISPPTMRMQLANVALPTLIEVYGCVWLKSTIMVWASGELNLEDTPTVECQEWGVRAIDVQVESNLRNEPTRLSNDTDEILAQESQSATTSNNKASRIQELYCVVLSSFSWSSLIAGVKPLLVTHQNVIMFMIPIKCDKNYFVQVKYLQLDNS